VGGFAKKLVSLYDYQNNSKRFGGGKKGQD
jgi:hypothetical protein